MAFIIQGPYPNLQTSTILPSPEFSNQENVTHDMNLKSSVNGTQYTYIKKKDRKRHLWNFRVDRAKGLELRAFFLAYFASEVRIEDHCGGVWKGYFTNNPFEFSTNTRSQGTSNIPGVAAERQQISIEFEGVLI